MKNRAEAVQTATNKNAGEILRTLDHHVVREYRKSIGESQRQFWSRFGVTQSRGSRIELGGDIPAPVAILLWLYLEGVISKADLRRAHRRRLETSQSARI